MTLYNLNYSGEGWISTNDLKASKHQNEASDDALENRLIAIIKSNSKSTQNELATELSVFRATVQRLCKELSKCGILERKDGRRHGCWEIHDELMKEE